jgi:hypothetical protein
MAKYVDPKTMDDKKIPDMHKEVIGFVLWNYSYFLIL